LDLTFLYGIAAGKIGASNPLQGHELAKACDNTMAAARFFAGGPPRLNSFKFY
jgi:hypothetical protein